MEHNWKHLKKCDRKESSLHPSSKILYRSLATTDLLVGLVAQPLYVTFSMSLVYKDWNLCRYAIEAAYITSLLLCGVSLATITVVSVDRFLALSLRLRYKQIVTLKRIYIILATFWLTSGVASFSYILDPKVSFWCSFIVPPPYLIISITSYTKIFRALSHRQSQASSCSTEPAKCTKHGAV